MLRDEGLILWLFFFVAARQFGTKHVLVLYDFSPSTRTTDLERIFEKFGDHGVAIRWVNDTSALAVFRTPSAGTFILTALSNAISTWLFFWRNQHNSLSLQ